MAPVIAEMEEDAAPNQESWDVHTIITQARVGEVQSRRRMEFRADYVAWFETEDAAYQLLKSVDVPVLVHLYDADGRVSATLAAREVKYHESENRLQAFGEVVVETQDDKNLYTDTLIWRERDRTISTKSAVHITTPTEDVHGTGLVADEDLTTYQLGRFTARIVVEE